MTVSKEGSAPLRRLGGGRWATRDGRFTIEPQGGTWVVVDSEQVDDLGLPRVRGPFSSLGDAREAIAALHDQPAESSPLARRIDAAGTSRPKRAAASGPRSPRGSAPEPTGPPTRPQVPRDPQSPRRSAQPTLPRWLAALPEDRRRTAETLIADVRRAGLADAERLVRTEIESDRPAIARALLERRLRAIVADHAGDRGAATIVAAVLRVLADEGDPAALRLPGWRLTDERGRAIQPSAAAVVAPDGAGDETT